MLLLEEYGTHLLEPENIMVMMIGIRRKKVM
jgi:hypothetical protein